MDCNNCCETFIKFGLVACEGCCRTDSRTIKTNIIKEIFTNDSNSINIRNTNNSQVHVSK